MNASSSLQLLKDTLLILPCSGKKRAGTSAIDGQSIASYIDSSYAKALADAQARLRESANVDETTLMPAFRRYSGQLYQIAGESIGHAVESGTHVLIVSGGYGLLNVKELIGTYEKEFAPNDWPSDLLQSCLLDFAGNAGIRSVIAVMARSTEYAKFIRQVAWRQNGIAATLVSPTCPPRNGAQGKVPRAQGQIVCALIAGKLTKEWRSSYSLPLEIESL